MIRKDFMSFLQKLLGRCVTVQSYKDKDLDAITHSDLNDETILLPPQKVMIGFTTRATMREHEMLPNEEAKTARKCQTFMLAAIDYAIKHLPLTDPLLKYAEVLNFSERMQHSFDSMVFFVEKFPTLKSRVCDKMDAVYDQFTRYQLLSDDHPELVNLTRVDHQWACLGKMKTSDAFMFDLLFEIARYVLVLPHSNAEEERIFSTVAKNKTDFRACLSNKTTLPSILTCKTNYLNKTSCFNFEPSASLL